MDHGLQERINGDCVVLLTKHWTWKTNPIALFELKHLLKVY